jgi:hypothetical protein
MHLGHQFECKVVLDSNLEFQIGLDLHLVVHISCAIQHILSAPYVLLILMLFHQLSSELIAPDIN